MAMDVPRGKEVARRKLIRRIVIIVLILAAIPLITWGLSRLKPAAPSVDRATVWIDTVKRGPMVRDVRGLGTLVVEQYMWIPAAFDSRVDKINFLPGASLHANDVLMVLSNPDMELAAADLEWQIKAAEANLDNLRVTLETQQLAQKATTEQVKSDMEQAELQADRDTQLTKLGLKSDLDTKLSVAKWNELKGRYALSKEQLDISDKSIQAQVEAQKVQIEKLQAAYKLKKEQVEQLIIRSGTDGTLTQLGATATPLEVGMRVSTGTILAKIAQPKKLKATLKISETLMKDVTIGQSASIDTRNGIVPGHVSRIDPAAVNGTVDVDVTLEGPLPPGARPDLSVDGTITLERLADVEYVGRPVIGQPGAKITLFKLDPDGKDAQRVPVSLGRGSVNNIEVVDGLKVGDQVILSDMSSQDQYNRIRLN
ncbi:MAG TPA: HlyD family efflux transporter periplasmic adaptor subunit [Bryobacteraceae bacterium]|jgi:HlyD family secretion protein|nr:HlyD family efflux transporter periplasmic adaptor subunit [Bryobacteraceae bacterium]